MLRQVEKSDPRKGGVRVKHNSGVDSVVRTGRAQRLVRKLVSSIRRRVYLARPKMASSAILYRDRAWMIKKWILRDISCRVVDVDGRICIHPKIILSTLVNMRHVDWRYIYHSDQRLLGLAKQVYEAHLLAILKGISPKVVLTTIDDSMVFHRLSKRHRTSRYFAIMNGHRSLADFVRLPSLPYRGGVPKLAETFCFGHHDIDAYRRYSWEAEKFHPVGAFVWGCYQADVADEPPEVTYDLCYVSQWDPRQSRPDLALAPGAPGYSAVLYRSLASLENNLVRLMNETGIRVLIALKTEECEEEREYYRARFGEEAVFGEANRSAFSAYRAMDSARLILTLNSTCGVEAFGAGRKVLFFNALGHPHYGFHGKYMGLSYLEGEDYGAFKERLTSILGMDISRYREATRDGARYLMNDDPQNPAHVQIRQRIREFAEN